MRELIIDFDLLPQTGKSIKYHLLMYSLGPYYRFCVLFYFFLFIYFFFLTDSDVWEFYRDYCWNVT